MFLSSTRIQNTRKAWTPNEAAKVMEEIYCSHLSVEYMSISDVNEKQWIRDHVERIPLIVQSHTDKLDL